MAQDTREHPSGIIGRYAMVGIFLLMATLAIVIGVLWFTMQDDAEEDANPAGGVEDTSSRISEILSNPEQFQDQPEITLVGETGEVLNDRTFLMVSGDEEAKELVVASTTPFTGEGGAETSQQVTSGTQVQVIGSIKVLSEESREALGEQFAYLLDDPAYDQYEGEPVLLTNLDGIDVQGTPDSGD